MLNENLKKCFVVAQFICSGCIDWATFFVRL